MHAILTIKYNKKTGVKLQCVLMRTKLRYYKWTGNHTMLQINPDSREIHFFLV